MEILGLYIRHLYTVRVLQGVMPQRVYGAMVSASSFYLSIARILVRGLFLEVP